MSANDAFYILLYAIGYGLIAGFIFALFFDIFKTK